jgi:hypothetical protein
MPLCTELHRSASRRYLAHYESLVLQPILHLVAGDCPKVQSELTPELTPECVGTLLVFKSTSWALALRCAVSNWGTLVSHAHWIQDTGTSRVAGFWGFAARRTETVGNDTMTHPFLTSLPTKVPTPSSSTQS